MNILIKNKIIIDYWINIGEPNISDFKQHLFNDFGIELLLNIPLKEMFIEIKNQNKYTMFLLKYG